MNLYCHPIFLAKYTKHIQAKYSNFTDMLLTNKAA